MKYHLGCGNKKIQGFVNVDVIQTAATDLVYDFNNGVSFITTDTAELIFSNAVFEHLYPPARLKLLYDCQRALSYDGILAFVGIPDFESVAQAYIYGYPSNVFEGEKFGLYDVTRYTHGGTGNCGWSEQDIFSIPMLHKTPLDSNYLLFSLNKTGYNSYIIFKYLWGKEKTYATMGMVAKKLPKQHLDLQQELGVVQYQTNINWDSVRIIARK